MTPEPDYYAGLIGGVLIGLAGLLLMASHGRIMGISGIVGSLLPPAATDRAWRAAFVAGILCGPPLYLLVAGQRPPFSLEAGAPLLIAGGFLVGLGTALGNGCTSGHGVCGVSRLSPRSLLATAVFMASAIATVALVRHGMGG